MNIKLGEGLGEKIAEKVVEKVLKTGKKYCKRDLERVAIDVGVDPATPSKDKKFLELLKEADEKAVKIMNTRRLTALQLLQKKEKTASYKDLINGIDVLTKNKRLLTGESTQNVAMKGSIVMLPSPQSDKELIKEEYMNE